MRLKGEYTIQQWEQKTLDESAGLDEAQVTLEFSGDITGTANTRYLMIKLPGGSAEFTGLVHVSGVIAGRHGSFVMQETGQFNGVETAFGTYSIVSQSGRGDLTSIRGSGAYLATHGDQSIEFAGQVWEPTPSGMATYVLEADFDSSYDDAGRKDS